MPIQYGPNPANGQYYPGAIGGSIFMGANQAVVATALAAGLTASYTGGLILWNPVASTKNLVILRAQAAFILAETNPAVIGLGVGSGVAPTGTLTLVPIVNGNPGSSVTPSGILYSSATITLPAAPVLARILGAVNTGAETTAPDSSPLIDNIEGAIVLSPGSFACFTSSAAGTASSFFGGLMWAEQPAGATAG